MHFHHCRIAPGDTLAAVQHGSILTETRQPCGLGGSTGCRSGVGLIGSLAQGTYVASPADNDLGVMAGIDLPGFWETLKLRWWVIPAVIGVAVAFLWAQESDLRSEPGSYIVSQTYEARDSTAVLASVGIDPVSVRAFPDANNQLLVLQSAEVRAEIAAELGRDVTVSVTRSRPSFTLIDTLESDGQSSFVFQSAGVPTYTFSCNEPTKASCVTAIDAYVAKAAELRREALTAGLEDLQAVLTEVQRSAPSESVATQIAAIDVLMSRLDAPLRQISAYEEAIGATIASVRRPTYTFGVTAGLLISLLILLQLTHSDSRVRSMRQLVRLVGAAHVIGHIAPTSHTVRDRRAAVSLHRASAPLTSPQLRFLALRDVPSDTAALQRVAALAAIPATFSSPFAELSVAQLTHASTNELDVIVVQRNRDLRKDVVEVVAALANSGRSVAGVLLVD